MVSASSWLRLSTLVAQTDASSAMGNLATRPFSTAPSCFFVMILSASSWTLARPFRCVDRPRSLRAGGAMNSGPIGSVMVSTSIVLLRLGRGGGGASIRPTHLMLLMPTQPGTIARTGKPWSGGAAPVHSVGEQRGPPRTASRGRWQVAFTGRALDEHVPDVARVSSGTRRAPAPSQGAPVHSASPMPPSRHWSRGRPSHDTR